MTKPSTRYGVSLDFEPPSLLIVGNNDDFARLSALLITMPSGEHDFPAWILPMGGVVGTLMLSDHTRSQLEFGGNRVELTIAKADRKQVSEQILAVAKHKAPSHAYIDNPNFDLHFMVTTESYSDSVFSALGG